MTTGISRIKKAILKENLSGWLFFNFKHRDPLSDLLLKIDKKSTNTRGWFYIIIAAQGDWQRHYGHCMTMRARKAAHSHIKIVHSVEPDALKNLPGKTIIYTSREELKAALKQFSGMCFAAQTDQDITQISFLDSGTASILHDCKIKIVSSASLIKNLLGNLDNEQILLHKRAATLLYKIIEETWDHLSINFKKNKKISEGSIQSFILEKFKKNNLITSSPPLVAFGKNSANPHYTPHNSGNPIFLEKNTIIQFDIWAKLKEQGDKSVYADISWVGFSGNRSDCPAKIIKSFNAITGARDSVIAFIKENIKAGKEISGFDADEKSRNFLFDSGYKKNEIKHRTGHAIDIELHGYGTNLDSIEFPDKRTLSNGSCFSIEPGLYFKNFGMRTEINCYITNNRLYVSGGIPQKEILML